MMAQDMRQCILCFNPRAREGRDPSQYGECPRYTCFNPRAREGRDPPARRVLLRVTFQSTRPRGARRFRRMKP